MKVEIKSKEENPLLARQEVEFTVKETTVTPSRKELRQQIAAIMGADEKKLVVDVFRTSFGTTDISGTARIYKEEKDMKRIELEPVLGRNFGRPEKAKKQEAEAAPEQKK
ncbi:MAG: 30S ribosomal protein S24e [Candidatus Diapherotrites archaeon]|uniref:Small ribosomal subunit protein eS24 n=1 Tax=Candidatus Iainarchaeum sp. TaxID=3101447 RepID=A0A8T3YKG9_9ARCH|nr:30S ribosomal protein S24e [Candidatus Diapherotrites archaeon]